MALIKFISNIFKKIAKLFKRGGKKKDDGGRLPGERRIGIYGPSNVGKSVFFTMLYKACRQDRVFNLSPDDPATGSQLVTNLNTLRGGDWLPGTVEESELNFKASLRGGSQFPFSTRDYKGETVDLEQEGSAKEKLIQYFQHCDAILFLISPEMIADPRKCEREIMSFTAMINQVTEHGGKGLRIPIGLMITKADEIEGFENESQVDLIGRKAEYLKAKDFETFVEGVCGQYHVARNIVFQEEVRQTLRRLSLFFDFLMTLSMEFQVFFVSSVGHVRKSEDPSGKVTSRPPEDPDGIGVKVPFLWVIDTIRRRERIAAVNGVRRFVFRLALVILVFYSIFYGWHLIPARDALVKMEAADVSPAQVTERLEGEANRFIVRNFSFFSLPGTHASEVPEKTEQLAARYEAHRFLNETLPSVEGAQAVRTLAEEFGTEGWERANSWYTPLLGTQRTMVTEAVWAHVAAHNVSVAQRIEDLYTRSSEGADLAALQDECGAILQEFVEPQQGLDEHRRLVARYGGICDRIGLAGTERRLLEQWEDILEELEEIADLNAPPASDIEKLRASVSGFEDEAKNSGTVDLRDKAREADAMDGQLRNMQSALAQIGVDDDEYLRLLRRIQSESVGALEPLRRWSQQRQNDHRRGKTQETIANLATEVKARLDDPSRLYTLLSRDFEGMVGQARLEGTKAVALRRYFSALKELRTEGVSLTLNVVAVPDGFVVVWWDQREERWNAGQAQPGIAMNVKWTAALPVRVGIVKRGATEVSPCGTPPMEIEAVQNQPLLINCAGTAGATTQIDLQGLDRILRDRLAAPLAEAFGP